MKRTKFDLMVYMIPDYFKQKIQIPDIQREDTAWGEEQKQTLIDSLYNDFDIPKIYLRKNPKNSSVWWLIDGQQRLTAINDFLNSIIGFGESSTIPAHLHNKKLIDLETERLFDDKERITGRTLDCIIVECNDDEEEDMFIRLNNGTPLSAAEKRNAIRGEFRDSVKDLAEHMLFSNKIAFTPKRFAVHAVVSQLCAVTLSGGPTDTKGKILKKLYEDYRASYPHRKQTERRLTSILNLMNQIFPHKEPYMKKYNVLSVFLFLLELKENFAISSLTPIEFYSFFTDFETLRHLNSQKSEDDPAFDLDLNKYQFACVNSPDSETGVRDRHEVLLKKFF